MIILIIGLCIFAIDEVRAFELSEIENNEIHLSMHVLDVGHGLALLFESDDRFLLYDGGDREYSSKVVSYLKEVGVETIDAVIVSHYDADHLNGIVGVLNVFKVLNVIAPDYSTDTRVYESFIEILDEKGLSIINPMVGQQYSFGSTTFTILAPNATGYLDDNDYSVSLRLEYGDTSIMVTGDATNLSEKEMLCNGQDLQSDIMVLGHHGSDTSASTEFLQNVAPSIAIISCGDNDQYNNPSEYVMEQLKLNNISVLRTDKQGDLTIGTNGTELFFSVAPGQDYSYAEKEADLDFAEDLKKEITYILNNNSKKFHYQSCYSAEKIAEHNYSETQKSRDVLIEKGYSPCGNCKP